MANKIDFMNLRIKSVMLVNVYIDIGKLLSFVYFMVGWHASAVSLPPGDAIFAQLLCPLNDVIFCLHRE
jgi:hypothetical protein